MTAKLRSKEPNPILIGFAVKEINGLEIMLKIYRQSWGPCGISQMAVLQDEVYNEVLDIKDGYLYFRPYCAVEKRNRLDYHMHSPKYKTKGVAAVQHFGCVEKRFGVEWSGIQPVKRLKAESVDYDGRRAWRFKIPSHFFKGWGSQDLPSEVVEAGDSNYMTECNPDGCELPCPTVVVFDPECNGVRVLSTEQTQRVLNDILGQEAEA